MRRISEPASIKKSAKKEAKWNDNIINKKIRELLEEKNIKIDDFSAALFISTEAVRLWTSGYARPDIDKLIAISEYLGVSTDYLLGKTLIRKPNADMQAISDKTGLSESVINILMTLNMTDRLASSFSSQSPFSFTRDFVNPFFSNEDFIKKLRNLLPSYFDALVEKELKNIEKDYCKKNCSPEQAKNNDFFENAIKHDVTYADADVKFFLLSRLIEDFIKEFYDDFSKKHLEKIIEEIPDVEKRTHAMKYLREKAPHLYDIDTTKKGRKKVDN